VPNDAHYLHHLQPFNEFISISAFVMGAAQIIFVANLLISLFAGKKVGRNPWKANTLEWGTESPPPVNNFDVVPRVRSVEPMKDIRREVARNTGSGVEEVVPVPESLIRG